MFGWGVVGTAVCVFIGIGVGVMSMNPPEYVIAEVSFSLGAIILMTRIGWWLFLEQSDKTSTIKLAFSAFLIFGIIGALWILSLRWINERQRSAPNGVTAQSSEVAEGTPAKKTSPPTLRKLFESDFGNTLRATETINVTTEVPPAFSMAFTGRQYFNFKERSKFLGIFVPASPNTYRLCELFLDNYKVAFNIGAGAKIFVGMAGEDSKTPADLIFTKQIYIYHESELTIEQKANLIKLYRSKDLVVVFRGFDYLMMHRNP